MPHISRLGSVDMSTDSPTSPLRPPQLPGGLELLSHLKSVACPLNDHVAEPWYDETRTRWNDMFWIVVNCVVNVNVHGFGLGPKIRHPSSLLVWPSRTACWHCSSQLFGIMVRFWGACMWGSCACINCTWYIALQCFAHVQIAEHLFLHCCIPPLVLKHSCECR